MQNIALINTKAVTKSRFIVKESYALSLAEHRLLLSCISKIDRRADVPDEITITAEEFKRDWPEVKTNVYGQMQVAVKTLWERTIKLSEPDKKKRVWLRWVQRAEYDDGKGVITLRFSEEIKPLLGNLKDNFVQLRMNEVKGFKSAYTIRLFELLMQFKKSGYYTISVDDFKVAFGVDEIKSYKRFSLVKLKILDVAVKEINAKSGWEVGMDLVKKGRTVTHLQFFFGLKKQTDMFGDKPVRGS